jgi:predicted transcriptional regulator
MRNTLDTSLIAFTDIRPQLGDRQKQVYALLASLPPFTGMTNSEIAQRLDMPINCITPRVNELRAYGKVTDNGKRHCKVTGKLAYEWRITKHTLF